MLIRAINKVQAPPPATVDAPPPPEDILLLREIRDSLKK
jgi:large conductance mechanosensitive channel